MLGIWHKAIYFWKHTIYTKLEMKCFLGNETFNACFITWFENAKNPMSDFRLPPHHSFPPRSLGRPKWCMGHPFHSNKGPGTIAVEVAVLIEPWRLLPQSGGGPNNSKAEDASPFLKRWRPLLQSSGGPGVAKAPEALAPKPRGSVPQSGERPRRSQSGAGQIGPKAAEAVDLGCRRSGYSQRSKGPRPSLAEDPAPPSAGRSLPQSGGGPRVANTEECLSQKQQRPRCTQSGGGPCPKAVEAPVFPTWWGPLPQIGGGVGALQSHRGTCPKPGKPTSS